MARTNLTNDELYRLDRADTREAVRAKLAEHDVALDALEGGTTSSVVTIHPAAGMATGNVADLAAFTVANDGMTLTAGKRVFLPLQTDQSENGLYVVGTVAAGTAPLTRATDFDAAAEIKPGTLVVVAGGTVGAAGGPTVWQLTNTSAPVVGTDNITFAQMLNKTQLATYLALATQAGLIGSDAAGYTAETVKLQLAEVKAIADALVIAGSALLTPDALTADASGRAVFQDDFFDAATVAAKVDAKAIDTGSIADSAIETLQINDAAVTQAKLAAVLCGAPTTLSGAGAVGLTAPTCLYTSTGAAEALTVADATVTGHRVRLVHIVDGGSGVITQTTGAKLTAGITTITLADAFDWVELEWSGTLWNVIGYGGTGLAIA